jgi:teichoic acid transport system ATP-binding protein
VPRARRGRREIQWGARLLAPAAFLAAATVAVLLIRAGLDSNDGPTATPPPPATRSVDTTTEPTTTRSRRVGRTYTIREGDTFETIASDQGTTVERLEALNPDVDPNLLQVGQRIVVPG